MIIDATDLILGRLASFAAKKALLGEEINIINCEKVLITGKRLEIFGNYKRKRSMGDPHHGPFFPRIPELIVKRTIRGMLPYKQEKGEKAFKRIKCFRGIPEKFKKEKIEKVNIKEIGKLKNLKYINLGEICGYLGYKG